MDRNISVFGYSVNIKTILIVCIIAFVLFMFFNGENFTTTKKTCQDLAPGNCTSELCGELSFCKPQKKENSDKCSCVERKNDDN